MEFNWADPRKNKRVDTVMMAKAEASRVKRLTSVKSTVSNQLNPAVEHKLKTLKKKKHMDVPDDRPSSRLHQRDFDLGTNPNPNPNPNPAVRTSSSNNHSFYNEFLPHAKSIFDSIDVHAAADGLFHPASNVQAFAEHDARFGSAETLSTQRLPPLSGKSTDRSTCHSRSTSRLPTASSSSSSSSCSSQSLRRGTQNRSDGDLHAPRRVGIVPSSADRQHVMDLLDELDDPQQPEHDEHDDEDHEPQARSPPFAAARYDNNSEHRDAVPPLELDLAQKFAKLKQLIKTNREHVDERGPEVDEETTEGTKATKPAVPKLVAKTKRISSKSRTAATDQKLQSSTVDASTAVVAVPRKPATNKVHDAGGRYGVSLSDLKEEHRAARAMLRELGGPVHEADDGDKKTKESHARVDKTKKSTTTTAADASGSRLVDKLRARIPSGRDRVSPRVDDTGENATTKYLVTAALDAARVALDKTQEATAVAVDEQLWQRYEDDKVEEEEDDDPSDALYDDEGFEA